MPQTRQPELKVTRQPARQASIGFDLTRLRLVHLILRNRWPQFLIRAIALAGFIFAILTGLLGTPVGSRNFGIVFVWIAWWALLMLIAVPIFGRGWCSICPIPMPGEWLQQGAILDPQGPGLGLGRRWPKRLRNIWLQNGAFALVALFSAVVLTNPQVSAIVLASFLFIAIAASLIFERRAFCRYLCPVGGFIGLYSQLSPIELRVRESSVCATHAEKTCYTGSTDGYGCPWQVFPGGLVKNTYCGTCMECLRTCPHDNIAINLRLPGRDLLNPTGRKMDEAFKAFIMLGSAIVYSAVMLGPWGTLKSAAYSVGSLSWLLYALTFMAFVFGLLPGLFFVAVAFGQRLAGQVKNERSRPLSDLKAVKKQFTAFAYVLVPLGLAAWIAFSLSFVFTNLSYLWPALSDPFGWGWNLIGTSYLGWTPYLTQIVPYLQALVLLGGLLWASRTARHIASQLSPAKSAAHQALPVMAYCLLVTTGLLGLLIA